VADPAGFTKIGIYNILDAGSNIQNSEFKDLGDNEATDATPLVDEEWRYRNPAFVVDMNNNLWCFVWYMTDDPTGAADEVLLGNIQYKMSQDMGLHWSDWQQLYAIGEDNEDTMEQPLINLMLTKDNKIMILLSNDFGGNGDQQQDPVWLADP
jgi:hypothetical protein